MPAAAVIPAPIAYIKVVAVKKLVVGFWIEARRSAVMVSYCCALFILLECTTCALNCVCVLGSGSFTLKKLECSKQAFCLEYISME